ncbi:MAG: hypothetical protein V7749_00015 [Cocleimonas sp.]
MKVDKFEYALACNPSTSYWLKEQFKITKNRDPVDALNDAEALVSALKARLKVLEKSHLK